MEEHRRANIGREVQCAIEEDPVDMRVGEHEDY